MQTDSLTYKTLKNVSYSSFGYAWSLVFAIFITPIVVFKLGVDKYGVFIFINTIASLVGLIDLGISTAIIKYVSEYIGANREDKLKKLLYSANSLFLIIGLIGFIALNLVPIIANQFISPEIFQNYNIKIILFFASLTFFVNAINSIYVIIPNALQRLDITNKIGVTQTTLSTLSILLVVLMGFNLQTIFFVQLIISIIFTFIFRYYSKKLLAIVKFKFAWHKDEIKKYYKFGLVASLSNVFGETLVYFDKLIIPIFIGPVSLSYYSLSSSIASKSTGFISGISGILFPMVSNLQGSEDMENIKKLYDKAFRLATILSAAISFSIAYFSYKIIHFWLNEEIAMHSYKVLIVLSATYFIVSIYIPLKNFLLGAGETKILAIFSASIAILNIILLFLLLPRLGIMGAALAYLFSMLPVAYLFFYTEKKILNLEDRLSYYIKLYSKLLFTGFVFYFLSHYLIYPLIVNFKTLLFLGPFSVLIYLLTYKLFGFYDKGDWSSLKLFLLSFINKIKN